MKTILTLSLLFSLNVFAQEANQKKEQPKKDQMDYGDKQLLRRDTCRKPMEYLETRYSDIPKEKLQKMKEDCSY